MKQLKTFKVNEIWQLGTRIYFGDDFVSIIPFEQDAYEYFSKNKNDPTFGLNAHSYCKRINYIYTQNIDKLLDLKQNFESSGEFKNVDFKDEPSAIGLPKKLCYTHIKTDIKTEFDGVIFISEKRVSDRAFQIEDAKDFVEQQGLIFSDNAQIGSRQTNVGYLLSEKCSAICNWRYVTNTVDFSGNRFNPDITTNQITLVISLVDSNMICFTMPTQTVNQGKEYYFYIGNRTHIREVIAHELETLRYLKFLENRLNSMRKNLLNIQAKLFQEVPLIPWSFKLLLPQTWSKAIGYSTELQRCLETTIKYRLYLPNFGEIFDVYRDFEQKGVGFYNLTNPIIIDDKPVQSQYETYPPYPLEVSLNQEQVLIWLLFFIAIRKYFRLLSIFLQDPPNFNYIEIKEYSQSLCTYAGYPKRLKELQLLLQNLADETFELLQSITVIPALQTGIIAAVVALFAMFITLLSLLLAPAINNLYTTFQQKNTPQILQPQETPKFTHQQSPKIPSNKEVPKVNPQPTPKAQTQKSPTTSQNKETSKPKSQEEVPKVNPQPTPKAQTQKSPTTPQNKETLKPKSQELPSSSKVVD